jgi:MYXO-CTERM domain-containing protein
MTRWQAVIGAVALAGVTLAMQAYATPPANTRDQIIARGKGVVGFSYWWGHGRWSTTAGTPKGSCSGGCPGCSHYGSYGADCSGFVAKAWQVPSAISVTTDAHPYSTYNFYYESQHWSSISRGSTKKADSMVYRTSSGGHIFLFESGDPWGWMTAIECKGCSYGCVRGGRSATSAYVTRRRDNITEFLDKDGDGVADGSDNCPTVSNASQTDTDKDGKGNSCDTDDDNDGKLDTADNCPTTSNATQTDTDKDGKGDSCDTDDDADGLLDDADNCPKVKNATQEDTDLDGIGDACEDDDDADGFIDTEDNCPTTANADQDDTDLDGSGNACEDDDDQDGVLDAADNCPLMPNFEQENFDSDKQGDACDDDTDGDGYLNDDDLCPMTASWDQSDSDEDGEGDACDNDADGDGVLNVVDNCPQTSNADQVEGDNPGIGSACSTGDLGDPLGWEEQPGDGEASGEETSAGCACRTVGGQHDNDNKGGMLTWLGLGLLAFGLRRRRE